MKLRLVAAACTLVLLPRLGGARDFGVRSLPIHKGKLTSSLLYEHLKLEDDFGSRGRIDFQSHLAGAQFSYGLTDDVALSIKGATLVDPRQEGQGNAWESRSGYLYGLDLLNEVFPATAMRPGVKVSAGVTGFQIPLDRQMSGGQVVLVDQKLSGLEYHGAVLLEMRFGRFSPYAGLRGFGSNVTWRDHAPASGSPAKITGHAHGNISIAAGCPVQLSQDVRFQLEGRFINETALTAGFTIATF